MSKVLNKSVLSKDSFGPLQDGLQTIERSPFRLVPYEQLPQLIRSGLLTKQSNNPKVWKKRRVEIREGNKYLYYFKSESDNEYAGVINLTNYIVELFEDNNNKGRGFYLLHRFNRPFSFQTDDIESRDSWVESLKKLIETLPEDSTGTKPFKSPSNSNLFSYAKKNVAYRVANSSVGKKQILKMLPQETQDLIKAISSIVESLYSSKEKAKMLEDNLIKFLVKLGVEHDSKNISFKILFDVDKPFRDSFEILLKLYDYYGENVPKKIDLVPYFQKVETLLKIAEGMLEKLISPVVTPKTLLRLKLIFRELSTVDFFEKLWADTSLDEHLFELYHAMMRYTQFHYHSNSRLTSSASS